MLNVPIIYSTEAVEAGRKKKPRKMIQSARLGMDCFEFYIYLDFDRGDF